MKYAILLIALCGCNWFFQEQVAEDVIETIVKDETGFDLGLKPSIPAKAK